MTLEEAKRVLADAGYGVLKEKRLGNDTGWQLRFISPQIVNVFDTGNINVQGKPPVDLRQLFEGGQE